MRRRDGLVACALSERAQTASREKYGDGRVEAICQSALAFDVVNVVRIAGMLKSASKPTSPSDSDGKVDQFIDRRDVKRTLALRLALAIATQ